MNVRGVAAAYGAGILNIISAFVSNVWLYGTVAREVDKPILGIFLYITTTAGYLGLLQLSLDFAAGQRIAAALATGDESAAARALWQVRALNRALAAVILVGVVVVAAVVLACDKDPDRARLVVILVGLTGLSQVAVCLARPAIAGLTGAQNVATIQLVRFAGSLTSSILALGLIRSGFGVLSLSIADAAIQLGIWAVLAGILRRRWAWASVKVIDARRGFGYLIRFGAAVSLTSLVNYACINCDPYFLLLTGRPEEATAEYYVWARFPMLFYSMNYVLISAVMPGLSAAFATDPARGRAAWAGSLVVLLGISYSGLVGMGMWLAPVVRAWAGPTYDLPEGARLGPVLAAGVGLRNLLAGLALLYYATGIVRAVTIAHSLQLAAKLALGLALVGPYTLVGIAGADAAAAGVAVAFLGSRLIRSGAWSVRSAGLAVALYAASVAVAFAGADAVKDRGLTETVLGIAITGLLLAAPATAMLWRHRLRSRTLAAAEAVAPPPEVCP
jgi:hypothetical protein